MVLWAFGLTDKGRIRSTNEDCFAIDERLGLCVIADGMGGHNAGEVAARIAVDAVVEFVRERSAESLALRFRDEWSASVRSASRSGRRSVTDPASYGRARRSAQGAEAAGERQSDWPFGYDDSLTADANVLRTAMHLANVQILETAITTNGYAGMGTTVVAARAVDGRLVVAHVGDSRLYLLGRGGLRQITRDDSWMASVLAQDPAADPLMLIHHPMRNALTNVVGARARTDVHIVEEALVGGERLLLSTDGVHGVLDDDRIAGLLAEDEDPREIARRVIAASIARGSRDNCTAIVARYAR